MIRLIDRPNLVANVTGCAGPTGHLNGWELSLTLAVGTTKCVRAVVFGWGWDDEVPLRPWPQVSRKPTPGGRSSTCVALLGFFVNMATVMNPNHPTRMR